MNKSNAKYEIGQTGVGWFTKAMNSRSQTSYFSFQLCLEQYQSESDLLFKSLICE